MLGMSSLDPGFYGLGTKLDPALFRVQLIFTCIRQPLQRGSWSQAAIYRADPKSENYLDDFEKIRNETKMTCHEEDEVLLCCKAKDGFFLRYAQSYCNYHMEQNTLQTQIQPVGVQYSCEEMNWSLPFQSGKAYWVCHVSRSMWLIQQWILHWGLKKMVHYGYLQWK